MVIPKNNILCTYKIGMNEIIPFLIPQNTILYFFDWLMVCIRSIQEIILHKTPSMKFYKWQF